MSYAIWTEGGLIAPGEKLGYVEGDVVRGEGGLFTKGETIVKLDGKTVREPTSGILSVDEPIAKIDGTTVRDASGGILSKGEAIAEIDGDKIRGAGGILTVGEVIATVDSGASTRQKGAAAAAVALGHIQSEGGTRTTTSTGTDTLNTASSATGTSEVSLDSSWLSGEDVNATGLTGHSDPKVQTVEHQETTVVNGTVKLENTSLLNLAVSKLTGSDDDLTVDDATVEAYDSESRHIDSTNTDSRGRYELEVPKDLTGKISVSVAGFEGNIYAGGMKHLRRRNVDFVFDKADAIKSTIDDESVRVIYGAKNGDAKMNPVANVEMLQAIKENYNDDYELIRFIDAGRTRQWSPGFKPIRDTSADDPRGATDVVEFRGTLDGNNHAIHDLYIDRSDDVICAGLFDDLGSSATIKDLWISEPTVLGERTGALAAAVKPTTNVDTIKIIGNKVTKDMDPFHLAFYYGVKPKNGKINIDNLIVYGDVTAIQLRNTPRETLKLM